MALYHGRNQFITIGTPANAAANINLTGDLRETSIPLDQDLGDITTAGSVGHRFYPGLTKSSGSFKFVVNGAANTSWLSLANYAAVQQANPSNYYSCNYGPGGTATNAPKMTFNFLIKSVSMSPKVADVLDMTVSYEVDNTITVTNY
jgi:hypothetical protein